MKAVSSAGASLNLLASLVFMVFSVTGNAQVVAYTVFNTNDSGTGSLREAINLANNTATGTQAFINFDIQGTPPHVIRPTTPLPRIRHDNTYINGNSQPPYNGYNGPELRIRIDFSSIDPSLFAEGLVLDGNFITVDGLHITGGFYGINVDGSDEALIQSSVVEGNSGAQIYVQLGNGVEIQLNRIGMDAFGNHNPEGAGIQLSPRLINLTDINIHDNEIGGTNRFAGIELNSFNDPSLFILRSQIADNVIGTDFSGSTQGSLGAGIFLLENVNDALIERNLIANSLSQGIINYGERVFIYENQFRCNAEGGINNINNSIGALPLPDITVLNSNTISDNYFPGGYVDIYTFDENNCPQGTSCQGETYLGYVTADNNGFWSLDLGGAYPPGTLFTVLGTIDFGSSNDGTSNFTSCMALTAVCPDPGPPGIVGVTDQFFILECGSGQQLPPLPQIGVDVFGIDGCSGERDANVEIFAASGTAICSDTVGGVILSGGYAFGFYTWSYTDQLGQTVEVTWNWTEEDNTPPQWNTQNLNLVLVGECGVDTAEELLAANLPSGTDNCGDAALELVSATGLTNCPPFGSSATFNYRFVLRDACGNVNPDTLHVEVQINDTTAPPSPACPPMRFSFAVKTPSSHLRSAWTSSPPTAAAATLPTSSWWPRPACSATAPAIPSSLSSIPGSSMTAAAIPPPPNGDASSWPTIPSTSDPMSTPAPTNTLSLPRLATIPTSGPPAPPPRASPLPRAAPTASKSPGPASAAPWIASTST